MFDMNAYSIAVFGIPLGQHGDAPEGSDPDRWDKTQTEPITDPWKDETP